MLDKYLNVIGNNTIVFGLVVAFFTTLCYFIDCKIKGKRHKKESYFRLFVISSLVVIIFRYLCKNSTMSGGGHTEHSVNSIANGATNLIRHSKPSSGYKIDTGLPEF